jgi:Holliday junction resolvase RusA-like endonuclease
VIDFSDFPNELPLEMAKPTTHLTVQLDVFPPSANAMYRTIASFEVTSGKAQMVPLADIRPKASIILSEEARLFYMNMQNIARRDNWGRFAVGAYLHVDVEVWTGKKGRWDLDNLAKALNDGFVKAGVIPDDSQVWSLSMAKMARSESGKDHMIVCIREIPSEEVSDMHNLDIGKEMGV